jgi:hypothetical protein
MDGSGDPIYINQEGQVFIGYHDTGGNKFLAHSFQELLEEHFFEW